MTPDELLAKYEGQRDAKQAACMDLKDAPYAEWECAFNAWALACAETDAARMMLAVCRSHGL